MSLQSARAKLVATDPAQLPAAVRAALLVQPLYSVRVIEAGAGYEIHPDANLPAQATRDLFCKLSIKSWRDGGSLRIVAAGVPLRPALENLLANPTAAQRAVARAWTAAGLPLFLHLIPYRSFVDVSEVRWLASPREVRFISACLRGTSSNVLRGAMPAMQRFAQQLASHLPERRHVVELACLPDGEIRLVEINPALRPDEIAALIAS